MTSQKLHTASISKTVYGPAVYEPSDDSFALVDALLQEREAWANSGPLVCVEIGCGSGFVICSAALLMKQLRVACSCIAVDVSGHAARATAGTLAAHGLEHEVDILRMDLLGGFHQRMRHSIDLLIFNPPYVVTPDEEVCKEGIAAAWAGGHDGRIVIDRLLADLDHYLSPSGRMYMITIEQNRPGEILRLMEAQHGLRGKVVLVRRADEELIKVLVIERSPAT